jgi:hypothetical protein
MVENLQKVIRAYGFDKAVPELAKYDPVFKNYAEFEGVLNGFARLFGECPGCVAGGGNPNCDIRQCCKQKNYSTCAECVEMETCEKLLREVRSLENMNRIKALGVAKYAKEMQKRVDEGYCQMDEIIK